MTFEIMSEKIPTTRVLVNLSRPWQPGQLLTSHRARILDHASLIVHSAKHKHYMLVYQDLSIATGA